MEYLPIEVRRCVCRSIGIEREGGNERGCLFAEKMAPKKRATHAHTRSNRTENRAGGKDRDLEKRLWSLRDNKKLQRLSIIILL